MIKTRSIVQENSLRTTSSFANNEIMDIVLNQIAIWQAWGFKELTSRKHPLGTRYREPDGVVYKEASRAMNRYAKDYEVEGSPFSLFVRTFCDDKNIVERALDSIAKKITKEYALQATAKAGLDSFQYTPFTFDPKAALIKEEN